jgi:hypothetical protein
MNAEIQRRLINALDYVFSEVVKLARPTVWSVAPTAHALQAQLREAAINGDIDAIRELCLGYRDFLTGTGDASSFRIVCWDETILSDAERHLLLSAFKDDIGLTSNLIAPDPEQAARVKDSILGCLEGLSGALPLWEQEFRGLVSMILLARSEAGGFGGASAFAAWGAILVNPGALHDQLSLALALIHESSHLKLFTAFMDDEIVLNDPSETFSSPLRREARPMVGIYHAAFVLARMIGFLGDVKSSGKAEALFGEEASRINEKLDSLIKHFAAAHGVILADGKLTPMGSAIIEEAAAGVASQRAMLVAA